MSSIIFRTMEPMMFRGASEFSPETRGPQTVAWSRPLPSPSTLAGALATLVLQHQNRSHVEGKTSAWYNEVIGIFGGKGSTVLKGPYLTDDEGVVYLHYKDGLLSLNELKYGLEKGELIDSIKDLGKAAKRFELGRVDLIGIKLLDMKKATQAGLIYSATMVDYGKIGINKNVRCSIMVEALKTSDSLTTALEKPRIMRLGGEGRLVKVMIHELQPISEYLRTEISVSNKLRLYVAAPIIFEATRGLFSNEEFDVDGATAFTRFGLRERLKTYLSDAGFAVTLVTIAGSAGILGGFSAAKAVRKPIYATLNPGSVVEIIGAQPFSREDCCKLYSEGLGLFRDLGYGTIIPIPVSSRS